LVIILDARWVAARILDGDQNLFNSIEEYLDYELIEDPEIQRILKDYQFQT